MKDGLEIIAGLGASPRITRLSGGGARSPFWHQLFADIFAQRVSTLATQEGSAFGAALLAAIGTGEYASVQEICRVAVHEVDIKEPDSASVRFYATCYRIYRSLYPALKPAFEAISELDS